MRRMGMLAAYSSVSFKFVGNRAWPFRERSLFTKKATRYCKYSRDNLTIFLPTTHISRPNIISLCRLYTTYPRPYIIVEVSIPGLAPLLLLTNPWTPLRLF